MNIALLTMAGPWGGTEFHTLRLAQTLFERGHRSTIVCLTEKTYEDYRKRSPNHLDVTPLPIPKDQRRMTFLDWRRAFAGLACDVCVLVKGYFGVGDSGLDMAAR